MYVMLVINMRAVAQGQYVVAVISDGIIALISFLVLRRIIKSTDEPHQWAGYTVGSMIGSVVGIYVSKMLESYG